MKSTISSMVLASFLIVSNIYSADEISIKAIVLQAAQEKRIEEFFQGVKVGVVGKIEQFAVVLTPSPDKKGFKREYFVIDAKDKPLYQQVSQGKLLASNLGSPA